MRAAIEAPADVASPTAAPLEAPSAITAETGVAAADFSTGVEGGLPDSIVGGVGVGTTPGPPPPPAPPAPPQKPLPVGGHIKAPTKTRHVAPIYPPIAMQARVQGIVIIEATIAANGKVVDARVLRSIPLLDQAAIDAVRQWEFTPTLLNGIPVPVVMTVTVHFTLQ